MSLPRSVLPGLLLLAAGCASAPPEAVATEFGPVRAATRADAEAGADRLVALAPRVRALLPELTDEPIELWVLDRFDADRDPQREAYTWVRQRRIHIHRENLLFDFTLGHELVHALIERSWRALPGIVEEGLADHVGLELSPADAPAVRMARLFAVQSDWARLDLRVQLVEASPDRGARLPRRVAGDLVVQVEELARDWTFEQAFALSALELARLDERPDRLHLRGVGFLLVDRVLARTGYRGLYALAEGAPAGEGLDWRELARTAGLDADPAAWRDAYLHAWGEDELRALAARLADELADVLVDWAAPGQLEEAMESPRSGVRARVGLSRTGRYVDVLAVPEVLAAVRRALAREAGSPDPVAGTAPAP